MNKAISLKVELETFAPARPKKYICDNCKKEISAHRKHHCITHPETMPVPVAEYLRVGAIVRPQGWYK